MAFNTLLKKIYGIKIWLKVELALRLNTPNKSAQIRYQLMFAKQLRMKIQKIHEEFRQNIFSRTFFQLFKFK